MTTYATHRAAALTALDDAAQNPGIRTTSLAEAQVHATLAQAAAADEANGITRRRYFAVPSQAAEVTL